ncbi:hypothetical protein GCM10027268_15220 [Brachybacterium huguangmaarense]
MRPARAAALTAAPRVPPLEDPEGGARGRRGRRELQKTFLAGRLRVPLRDGSSIDLRKRPGPLPEQFVATVRSLLGR